MSTFTCPKAAPPAPGTPPQDDGMTTVRYRALPADGLPWTGRDAARLRMLLDPKPGSTVKQMIVALIPAYNGAAGIAGTVRCLRAQTRPPDRIVVVANNCTDDTAAEARRAWRWRLGDPPRDQGQGRRTERRVRARAAAPRRQRPGHGH